MIDELSTFLSKILLFGEYGILKNSKAISIPFINIRNLEFGDLTDNDVKKSNKSISEFLNFLKNQIKKIILVLFNLKSILKKVYSLKAQFQLVMD